MSAFYCQNCDQCKGHDEINDRDDGKYFCDSCYEAHLCECGHEVKEEGDLCTDCQRAMKN